MLTSGLFSAKNVILKRVYRHFLHLSVFLAFSEFSKIFQNFQFLIFPKTKFPWFEFSGKFQIKMGIMSFAIFFRFSFSSFKFCLFRIRFQWKISHFSEHIDNFLHFFVFRAVTEFTKIFLQQTRIQQEILRWIEYNVIFIVYFECVILRLFNFFFKIVFPWIWIQRKILHLNEYNVIFRIFSFAFSEFSKIFWYDSYSVINLTLVWV